MTEEETQRRLGAMEARIDSIDVHGTRGQEAIRHQIGNLQHEQGKQESTLARVAATVDAIRLEQARSKPQPRWPGLLTLLATLAPLYALVIAEIVKH